MFTDEVQFLSAALQNEPDYELRHPDQERRKESLRDVKSFDSKVKIHVANPNPSLLDAPPRD